MRIAQLALITLTTLLLAAPQRLHAREIYLAAGGRDLLVIDTTTTGITLGRSFAEWYWDLMGRGPMETLARRDDSALTITIHSAQPPNPDNPRDHDKMVFVPSSIRKGDYDLLIDDYLHNAKGEVRGPGYRGYLHRLDDDLIVSYFSLAWDTPTTLSHSIARPLLQIATQLVQKHPTDLYARVVYWDALVRNQEFSQLATELETHKARYLADDVHMLRFSWCCAHDELESGVSSRNGQNAYDIVMRYRDGKTTLPEILRRFPEVLSLRECCGYRSTIMMGVPNFLEAQIQVKVIRTVATLRAFQGRYSEGFRLLLADYHLGRLMNARTPVIESLIGCAIRSISTAGMALLLSTRSSPPPNSLTASTSSSRWTHCHFVAPGTISTRSSIRRSPKTTTSRLPPALRSPTQKPHC